MGTGAGVRAGAAGAVQVLTKGKKLDIPAETLLGVKLGEAQVTGARCGVRSKERL